METVILVLMGVSIACLYYMHTQKMQEKNWQYYNSILSKLNIIQTLFSKTHSASSLMDLFQIHKLFLEYFDSEILLDNDIVECSSKEDLSPDNIYLGGQYHLITEKLSYWDSMNDKLGENPYKMDPNMLMKDLIILQYRNLIINALLNAKSKLLREKVNFQLNNKSNG